MKNALIILGEHNIKDYGSLSVKNIALQQFIQYLAAKLKLVDPKISVVLSSINYDAQDNIRDPNGTHVDFKAVDVAFALKNRVPTSPPLNRNFIMLELIQSIYDDWVRSNTTNIPICVAVEPDHIHIDTVHSAGCFMMLDMKDFELRILAKKTRKEIEPYSTWYMGNKKLIPIKKIFDLFKR